VRPIAVVLLSLGLQSSAYAQAHSSVPDPTQKEAVVTAHARGTFDVKLTPQAAADSAESAILGRLSIDKVFHGDLEGTSKGLMLSAGTSVKNSAGYVAIERVSGILAGKTGTFLLQHSGTMARGAGQLTISVIPDSGTGELTGIAGTMVLTIGPDGKHSYDFEYTLVRSP